MEGKLGQSKSEWYLRSTTKRYSSEVDIRKPKTDLNTVRWMITELEYTMHVPGCRLLGPNNESLRTTFYPFGRGFFTLLEQRIDSAILDKRFKDYMLGKGKEVQLPDIHPDDEVSFEDIGNSDDDLEPSEGGGKKTVVKSNMKPKAIEGQTNQESNDMIEEETEYRNTHGQEPKAGRDPIYNNLNHPVTKKNLFGSTGLWGNSPEKPNQSPTTHDNQYGNISGQELSSNSQRNMFKDYTTNENTYFKIGGQENGGNATTQVNSRGKYTNDRNSLAPAPNQFNNPINKPLSRHSLPDLFQTSRLPSQTGDEKIPIPDAPPVSHVTPDSIVTEEYNAKVQYRALDSIFLSFGPDAVQRATSEEPSEYVAKASFTLFGHIEAELHMLQTPSVTAGVHQRVTLPGSLSLGTLLPTLAGSPLDAIMLTNTTLTYRSKPTLTLPAGLTLATTIQLSGFLDPVNTLLRDVFHQDVPRIDVSGLISMNPDCLKLAPAPSGFTLCGELAEVRIELFGVLELTHLGVSIMGRRISSAGGYDYAYGFDGRGRIADIDLDFSMRKDRENYQVLLAMSGEIWKNVGGVVGVNVS